MRKIELALFFQKDFLSSKIGRDFEQDMIYLFSILKAFKCQINFRSIKNFE